MARVRAIVALMFVAACGGGGSPPSPTNPTPPSAPPPTPPPSAGDPMRVAVLLSTSRPPSADDVRRVFERANAILLQKTGEPMSQVDLLTTGSGSALAQAQAYVNARADAPPDGVLAFSDDQMSTSFGGYSLTFPMPLLKVNQFPSPVVGENRVYLAVVDFFHMYGRCGYDNAGNRVSSTSFGGECRNRSGSPA